MKKKQRFEKFYVLDGKTLVEVPDVLTWARWRAAHRFNCQIKDDYFGHKAIGEVRVSTIFLGVDHRIELVESARPPIVFETMIFGGAHDGYQDRCATYDEALAMHEKAVRLAVQQFKELQRDIPGA